MREFEVIEHADSPIGVLILRKRSLPVPDVLELTLEHQLLMSSAVTDSERALAVRAIELHGGTNLDVLVGGLGLGYTSEAVLRSSRVAHLDVVEYVKGIIDWVASGTIPLGAALMADARFHAVHDDVFARLLAPATKTYDLLLLDVDHSPDDRLATTSDGFYAEPSLRVVARHLSPGGIFGLWSTSDSVAFEAELEKTFASVLVEPIDFFNETTGRDETNWLFFAKNPRE